MNKSGLIDAVSKTTSLAKRDAEEAVNAFVHVVSKEVRSGRRVVVAGFGSFNPTHRGARMGRNPRTGAPVSISASRGVRFAASGTLKDILNGNTAPTAPKVSKALARPSKVAAKTATKKATTRTTKRVATKATKNSTRKAVRRTAGRAPKKVVGRAPVRKTTRAPARKATQQSARKAAGASPARKAIKRSAKKAVRRA